MLKTPLFIWIFITIAIVAALHFSALQFYLYWRFWWFDILTHFLGGFWVALSFLWLFFQFGFVNIIKNNKSYNLAVAFLASLFVGVMWEAFEYYFGIAVTDASNYITDTAMDISFDLVGGFAAYCIFLLKGYHKTELKK
ncbi:MAG: seg [Parcubacteria group bacterium]|nr:seg [Parcubacteria group bacterium]